MIFQVDKNLWRGPYTHPLDLDSIGIKNIICLQTPEDLILQGPYSEDVVSRKFGMDLYHYPLSDLFFPTDHQLLSLHLTMRAFQGRGNTFIHCTHGKDRTGIVCAYYRVKEQGWEIETALTEMGHLGFHEFPYFWWKWMLKRKLIQSESAP